MQGLFDREEFPVPRAEELEWTQRIALALEADPNMRMQAYEAVGSAIVWLQRIFAGRLKKQLGTKTPKRFEVWWAVAQKPGNRAAEMLGGKHGDSPFGPAFTSFTCPTAKAQRLLALGYPPSA